MTPKDSLPHGAPSANRAPLPWARLALAGLGALLVLFIVGPLLRLLILATPASLGEALRDQELLASIAKTMLHIDTLETRKSDSLDFHDVAVWSVKAALEAAYRAGLAAAKEER